MKKSVFLLACFLVLISIFTGNSIALAAVQPTDDSEILLGRGDTYYSFDSSAKTLIIGGNGAVPDFTTTDLQPWANWRKSGCINKIVVREGITYIGNHFFDTVQAAVIELPDSLTRIGSYAFADNYELTDIKMSAVIGIANNAFMNCSSLKSVFIPKSVTSIGSNAFCNCAVLENVRFESMNMNIRIGGSAFLKCPCLTSVDIPRYTTMSRYSFGFYDDADTGSVYENFTMNVFRDSKAYTYAVKYFVKYTLLDTMNLCEGDELNCEYFSDSLSEEIKYYFNPSYDGQYNFYSSGEVDVDCVLTDYEGNIIAAADDNSPDDLNFRIQCDLKAGEQYCFTVKSIKSVGKYKLYFMPIGIEKVEIGWNIPLSAESIPDGNVNVGALIKGLKVNFIYSSGYTYNFPFEENGEYLGMKMHYNSGLNDKVVCGENIDSITVGDTVLEFKVTVNHSYTPEIIKPDLTHGGYTMYTCVLCGDSYKSDFTDCLGTNVTGHIAIMSNPQGEIIENSFVPDVYIYNNDGEMVGVSDDKGNFNIDYAYDYLILETPFGPKRKVDIIRGVNDLGNIGIVYCDFYADGYINAKDFAALQQVFGEYDENVITAASLDIDNNGVIDFADWEYAKSYFTYGKLTESVYDN